MANSILSSVDIKVFSCYVKLFVNHNGGTVKIRFNFKGQEVIGEFKSHPGSCFLRDLHDFVERIDSPSAS